MSSAKIPENLFYKETQQQNGGGHSPALIVMAVLLNCVGIPGFLMNFSVVYVTIKNRTLHGSANFLLALSSLFEMGHQAGHLVFLWLALSGQNFISYAMCFRLMAFSVFCLGGMYVIMFCTGVDRFLCVLTPKFHGRLNLSIYLAFHCAFCLASCAYLTLSLGHCAELYPSYPVTGYFGDLFVGICSTLPEPALLLNLGTIFLYLIVGMYIWRQPTSSQFRIFRSLAVIIVVNIGGYIFESIMRLIVLQNLHLSNQMFWYITSYNGIILNISSACNAIVLFCLSKDYRAAYRKEFEFLSRILRLGSQNPSIVVTGAAVSVKPSLIVRTAPVLASTG
uniref:G_PROTEIN_RECEP_F1_2 domain-containing protein n=1 Tax=Globodera rostochiensis TaxID=31243 RepID=A0A914H449_GLORO